MLLDDYGTFLAEGVLEIYQDCLVAHAASDERAYTHSPHYALIQQTQPYFDYYEIMPREVDLVRRSVAFMSHVWLLQAHPDIPRIRHLRMHLSLNGSALDQLRFLDQWSQRHLMGSQSVGHLTDLCVCLNDCPKIINWRGSC